MKTAGGKVEIGDSWISKKNKMKAMILEAFGPIAGFKVKELDIPQIKHNEVLVEVRAISINPVDVNTRSWNWLSPQLQGMDPIILGWDISGVVKKSNSLLFKEGDEVFGMVNFPGQGKAYAEYVAAPAIQLAHKPANISHEEAAAATLAALTAWQSLFKHYHVTEGQRVLIHAASGGVGHYAVQMAKHAGAYVIGTSSAANREFVLALGANEHIDYQTVRFEEVVKDIDFVFETVGGAQIERSLDVIKPYGTLISIPSGISGAAAKKAASKQSSRRRALNRWSPANSSW